MSKLLGKILGDRKEWKQMEARADALPRDFRIVYRETKSYLFRFSSGDGREIVALLGDVLAGFEAAAASGKGVRDVVGEDVTAYCDDLLGDRPNPMVRYLERWRRDLNEDVQRQV